MAGTLIVIGTLAVIFSIGYLCYWFYFKFVKKQKKGLKLFLIPLVAGIILFVVGAAMTPDSDNESTEPTTHKTKKANKKAKSKNNKTKNNKKEPTKQSQETNKQLKTSTTPKPKVSSEDKAALASAEDYANEQNMSKAALYDQLVSKAGENFPQEAAQYAIDHVKADWNKNALESANIIVKTSICPLLK